MVTLKRVDIETAKELVQLGWAIPNRSLDEYIRTGQANSDIPYLDQVIKWFREEHNMHIEVFRTKYEYNNYSKYGVDCELWDAGKHNDDYNEDLFSLSADTYEEGQQKGIKKAIEILN